MTVHGSWTLDRPDFSQLPEIGAEAVGLGFWTARSDASGGLDAGDDVRAAPNRPGTHTMPERSPCPLRS